MAKVFIENSYDKSHALLSCVRSFYSFVLVDLQGE